jgi:pimeloyl-ACP methyl ester carboxylesterase
MKRLWTFIGFALLLCSFHTTSNAAQNSIDGHWEGALLREGDELKVAFDFRTEEGNLKGIIDSPDAGGLGIPLIKISFESPKVHFELAPAAGGFIFDGEVKGDTIAGSVIVFGRLPAIFALKRTPAKPVAYKQEEVHFQNGATTLAGTLMIPTTKGPHPAILLLPSSGPATRDSSRFLADRFARLGVAALIVDKRGTGGSTGDWLGASFDELTEDALAATRFLRGRKDIKASQIGVRGQSQGARIAAMAASRSKEIAFLMLVAAGSLRPDQQEERRVEYEMRRDGFSETEIAEGVALIKSKFDFARTGEGWEKYEATAQKAQDKKYFSYLNAPLSRDDPSFRFWHLINDYDPVPYWAKISRPVLAILGELDTNTPVSETATIMERSFKNARNRDYTIKVFPKAEHTLFGRAEKGQWRWPRFADGYLDTMTAWLLKHVKVST